MSKYTIRDLLKHYMETTGFSVAFSSSFMGMFPHMGALSVLMEENIEPVHVAGSSAGAVVAAMYANNLLLEEMLGFLDEFPKFQAFLLSTDPNPGLFDVLKAARTLLPPELQGPIDPTTHLRSELSISTFNLLTLETDVLREGDLASALAASMAVPVLFKPVWRGGAPNWDGFVGDVGGLEGLERELPVLYIHATNVPVWTSIVREFPRALVLGMRNLPFIPPWDPRERGEASFEQAKTYMKELLDTPIEYIGLVSIEEEGGGYYYQMDDISPPSKL